MTKTMIAAALLAMTSFAASAQTGEQDHGKAGHQHRNAAYEQGIAKVSSSETASPTDGKRLPGRDCKFYEGTARQHAWPQYEVGNPNRPECPPEKK